MAKAKKVETSIESEITLKNNQEQIKKKVGIAKISASYGRKVNLKSISSQFDNIDESFHATCWISFDNQEEFKNKAAILSNAVRDITEFEIGKTISKLMKMKEDNNNNALLGIGVNIEHQNFLKNELGDLSAFLNENIDSANETIKEFADMEEVELETTEA